MDSFLPFFIILFSSVSFAFLSTKIHIPWVVGLVLAGIVIGPSGIDILPSNETIDFLGETGLVFLMFMAGLETRIDAIRKLSKHIIPIALLNGLVPFNVGLLLGTFFGYSFLVSSLIGIIFMSSSIAIVIPSLEDKGLLKTRLGQEIMSINIMLDIISLILLSVFLQTERPVANMPLYLFYPFLIISLVALKRLLPKIHSFFGGHDHKDRFQKEVRSILLLLVGTVVVFEILGLHSIIAGFFAGFVFADYIKTDEIKSKLMAISYGVFIPTFFILVGAKSDIKSIATLNSSLTFTLCIVFGSMISKYVSGFVASKLVGYTNTESSLIGSSTIPQLSTTLAATFAVASLGLIDTTLTTTMILLSIVTTFLGPLLLSRSLEKHISTS